PDQTLASATLFSNQAAPRAFALSDHEPRRPAQLLADPMRDQRQVVQVEAQVIRARTRLRAPVLDDLQVVGLLRSGGLDDGFARDAQELLRGLAGLGQGAMLAGRRGDR